MAVTVREDRGAWWVFVSHQGRRTKRRIGTGGAGKDAAKSVAKTVSAQLALGDYGFLDRRDDRAITFDAYVAGWLETLRGRKALGTVESYGTVIRVNWSPVLGATTLTGVRRETIKRTVAGWLGAGATSGTVKNRLAILSAVLGSAVDDGRLTENPAARLGKWATQTKAQAVKVEVYTKDETRALVDAAGAEAPWVQPLVLVLARTGLRIGEALTLQWDDVDLSARRVTVRRTWAGTRRQRVTNAPKGNKERVVDLSQQCAVALRQHRLRGLGRWVFADATGEPFSARRFAFAWAAIVRTAGVPYRKPHTLRHTYATRLIEAGENLAYVRDQLGHGSIKITVDLYGHLTPGGNRSAVDKLDDVAEVGR